MWIYKGYNLKRSRSQVKINGTIIFLDFKNIDLDTETVSLSAKVQKVWSKSFCIMVANEMYSLGSEPNCLLYHSGLLLWHNS